MFGFGRKKRRGPPPKQQMAGPLGPPTYDGVLYSHVKGQVITAGAEVYAFLQRFDKPQYDLIGAGFHAGQMRPLQEPQVYANLTAPQNGVGGLQSGQMAYLPLVNNDLSPLE